MNKEPNLPKGHITLKEASKISGYAPDYVGQLIRKGKLYGRQIYFNVAWVTTEAALRDYMARGGEAGTGAPGGLEEKFQGIKNKLLSEARLTTLFKGFLYFCLALSVVLLFVLLYVLSVNIDRSLDRRALEKVRVNEQFR